MTLVILPFLPVFIQRAMTCPSYTTQLTTELILGQSALISCASVPLFCLGHYPEDNTHKLHGICDQGISFIKCCVPHQNFNLFYLMFDLGLSKTGANQNVLEMVSISASTIVQDTARSLQSLQAFHICSEEAAKEALYHLALFLCK